MRTSAKPIFAALVVAVVVGAPVATAKTVDGESDRRGPVGHGHVGDFMPGEVIVRFRPGATPADRREARAESHVRFDRSLPIDRVQVVDVDGAVRDAVERLERQPDVAYAQPNYRYRALAAAPNDTFFGSLWGLQDTALPNPGVNALAVWDTTRGTGQVIAVVDTGVALDHPDLDLWDGGPGGSHGFDFVDSDTDPDDFNDHGTHVAGTAAAIEDNQRGVAGVAPDAEVMAIRALDSEGNGSTDDIAAGIEFAATNGADVVNLSLGGPGDADHVMQDAIAIADALDVVVVAAAGNDGRDNDADGAEATTPCTLPNSNLICVAAITESGDRADFSNYGATTVDVGAPGTNVLSTRPTYGLVFQDGLDTGNGWFTGASNGGVPWGLVDAPSSEGSGSATDSPGTTYGHAPDADSYAESTLVKGTGIDLTGEHGCRMRFDLRRDLEEYYDYLAAGATGDEGERMEYFTGSSKGAFVEEEISISGFDDMPDVRPLFRLESDQLIDLDGVYVDDVRVLCRAPASSTGDYVSLDGTSMAAPHVAGVAALLRAASPSASDTDVVRALKAGISPLSSLRCRTVTGGAVDAAAALAALTSGAPAADGCPTPVPPPAQAQVIPPRPVAPRRANLTRAKLVGRVARNGTFSYRFRATPGLTGTAAFRTRKKAAVSRRVHLTVGRKRFAVGPSGRVTVQVKLSRRNLRILRKNRKLLLKATVVVRNAAGLSATAMKRLTLLPPRR